MKDKQNLPKAAILRQKAEELLQKKSISTEKQYTDIEILKLVQELDVHQIELEIQNEELYLANIRAETEAEKYLNLYDFAPSGYLTLSKKDEILELNFSGATLLGKERSQLLNKRFAFFIADQSKPTFFLFLEEIFESKTEQTCEIALNNPSLYLNLSGIISEDEEQCLVTMHDISQLKKAEENLIKTQLLLESTIESQNDTIIFSIDTNYNYLTFNKVHSAIMKLAYDVDIKVGMNILDCISSIEDRKIAKENYDRALRGESHSNIRIYGDIEKAHYESYFNPIVDSNHRIIGATGLARNITKRIQDQENLVVSEEKYRTIFETNRDSITIFRIDSEENIGNFIVTNPATTAIFGYTEQEILTMNIRDIEMASDEKRKERVALLLNNGKIDFETTLKNKKGNLVDVEIECILINYLNKPAVMNITRDITARKQNEENTRKAQENLSTILEAIPDMLFEVGIDGRIYHYQTYHNDLLAAPPEVFMGKLVQDILPPDVAKTCMEAIQEANKNGWSSGKQYALDLEQGKYWFELSASPIKGGNIHDKHFIILARDISVRKDAEKKLSVEKERLHTILELVGNPIFLKDNEHRVTYANNSFYTLFDLNEKSVIGKTLTENVPENQKEHFLRIDRKVLDTGVPDIREETLTVKGYKHTIITSKTRFIDAAGNKSLIGSIYDITERKQAELALKKEKQRLSEILIGTGAGTWEWNIQTGATIFNERWAEIIGYTLEELAPISIDTWKKYTHPDDLKQTQEIIEKHCSGELDYYESEFRMKHKNGDWVWVLDRGRVNKWGSDSRPLLMSGTHQNITEKKQAEQTKEETLNLFNNITSHVPGVVYQYLLRPDGSSCFPYASVAINEIYQVTPEEVREDASKVFATIHPDDYDAVVSSIQKSAKYLTPWKHEYSVKYKDGEVRHLYGNAKPQKLEDGSVLWHGYINDITEKKISENYLKENEEKYRSVVENSPDGVIIYMADKIAFINSEGVRMLGAKNKEEIIGKPVLQFVHPDSIEDVIRRMKEVLRDNYISKSVEEKFIRIDGTPFDVEIKGTPTLYEHKKAVQIIVHDITLRKQTTIELNKINRVYALISQINNLIIRTHNQKELFQEICNIAVDFGKFRLSWIGLLNDNYKITTAALAGYEDGYFTKININSIANEPEGRGPTAKAMREERTVICNDIANDPMMKPWRKDALERGYSSVISIPIMVRNKIIGVFNLYSEERNFFSSEEEISLLEKIILNISFALEKIQIEEDRKKTEDKIRQLSLAVEQSPVSIVITNTKGTIEYANPKFLETTRYSLEEIINQNPRFLKSGYTSLEEYKILWNTLNEGKEWHGEFHNKRKDGTLFWESASISPIVNTEGKITHFIAIKEDITQRKNVEKELVKSKERAEESDRLKLVFLANMSHEIRTPMNGILGFTELLKEPKLSGEEQQEYIGIIEKSGKRMLNIINDIISISRIESGQLEVTDAETNINEQLEYIHTFFKPEAKQKGIELTILKKLAAKDNLVKTDREKVYAVLTNLVKNALKFTNEGSIEFGCENKGGYLEFFVKDTGLGISKSQKKIIFERFRQANETISRAHEGSGLGLAISKAYVEMLDGRIWVESKQGKGSAFYFTIPILAEIISEEHPVIEEIPIPAPEENKVKDLKVLIVEDDAISKLLITIAVKPYSKEILKVSTGIEAIEACRNNPDIDLVMMDINMPEMGGYEATKNIREFNKDLVIIAQTANGLQSDRDNAIAAGCTDYISKPINIVDLGNLIQKYFNR